MYSVHAICISISSACSWFLSLKEQGLFVERKQEVDSRWDVRFMSSFICFPPLDLWVCHEQLKHAGQAKGPDKAEKDRLTTHWPAQMHQRTLNLKLHTMDNICDLQKYLSLLKYFTFCSVTTGNLKDLNWDLVFNNWDWY